MINFKKFVTIQDPPFLRLGRVSSLSFFKVGGEMNLTIFMVWGALLFLRGEKPPHPILYIVMVNLSI
jgi:hypothetical protein